MVRRTGVFNKFVLTFLLFRTDTCANLQRVSLVDSLTANQQRPAQPLLPQSLPEWLLELATVAAVVTQLMIVFAAWPDLPDRVPQHFSAAGKADAWGSKATLLLLPVVNIVVVVIMTIVSRFPHISNLPIDITPENVQRVFRLVRFQTIWLKAVVAFVFAYMSWRTIEQARGAAEGLGAGFLPFTIAAVGSAVAWFYFSLRRQDEQASH